MQKKIKYILLVLFCICIHYQSLAQTDTVYIYEDIVVYDTVMVYDTIFVEPEIIDISKLKPKSISLIQLDTVTQKANLLLISGQHAATFPINHIILDENFSENIKNSESMKKLSFFGIICFAFQSMVLAQSDYGLSIGGGTWWSKCNNPIVKGEQISSASYSPGWSAGIYFRQNLKSKFTFETQLNYKLLMGNYSYKSGYLSSSENLPDQKTYGLLWADLNSPNIVLFDNDQKIYTSCVVGEEASTINYHNIEIPLQIGYVYRKFNPYIGVKYSLKAFSLSEVEVSEDDGEYVTAGSVSKGGLNNFQNCFGLATGLNYNISDKWTVKVNYYHSFTKDYEYTGYLIDCDTREIESKDKYNWKSRGVEITINYSLKRKNKNKAE